MDKKERNEEIQSRREFFKNAAKATLPILGIALMTSLPVVEAKAATDCSACTGICTGCQGGCTGSCRLGCGGGCTGCTGCSINCTGTSK